MLKIRLTRLGRKKRPYYRMIVLDVRSRRNGEALDLLGFYDPVRKQLKLDVDKANAWVAKGAQVSTTAQRLLGLCQGKSNEIIALPKPKPKGQHAPAPAKAAEAEAPAVAEVVAEATAEAEEAPVVEEATA
jgi:small subunit ribosomal protein S16